MRLLSTVFYILISILGLSFVSLAGIIGVQVFRGEVTPAELRGVLRVIGGADRIVVPNDTYDRFMEFAKDEEKARSDLERNRGLPESREPMARRIQEGRETLQGDLEVVNGLLATEKSRVESLRGEVESQKKQVADLLRALDDEKKKNAIVEKDEATAKLRKTLSEMDAGDVALYLTQVVRDPSLGGPVEAARVMRAHLKADYSAEVLGEMQAQDRQRVIPLLENRFAGVPPDAVVKIFADEKATPSEQLVYMQQMNPEQALGVYLRLPASIQERISPQILRGM